MDVQVVGSVGIDGDSTRQRDALDVVFGFFVEIFTECSNVDTFLLNDITINLINNQFLTSASW